MTAGAADKIPKHIAVIMDGNDRWAKARGLPTKAGHRQGAATARALVDSCLARQIPYLTLFAFSSENWLRPPQEVKGLLALFLTVLRRQEIDQFAGRGVGLRFVGDRAGFPAKLRSAMAAAESLTRGNRRLRLTVAVDYGGRWDMAEACRAIAAQVAAGALEPAAIDCDMIHSHTSMADCPDPDLCIRTGGECRVSNFLLWQFAYTEFHFTDCYWPDFDAARLQLALDDFARRKRRFGRHHHAPERAGAGGQRGA